MERKKALFAPSILSADFSRMADAVEMISRMGGDWVHVDVMDGHFVPNLSFGVKMVEDIRPLTELPLDVHMMVDNPGDYIEGFAGAGADFLTFHLEAAVHAHRLVQAIREAGVRPGISLVPSTPVSALEELLPFVDLVLIMSVNPGFGGQVMIPSCLDKIEKLRGIRRERALDFLISVDGGINPQTAPLAREKGADVLVSGSAFFESPDPAKTAEVLKGISGK